LTCKKNTWDIQHTQGLHTEMRVLTQTRTLNTDEVINQSFDAIMEYAALQGFYTH